MNSKRKRKPEISEGKQSSSAAQSPSAKVLKVESEARKRLSSDNLTKGMKSRLVKSFYKQDCESLAKALLGKVLVRYCKDTGERLSGLIVETEAYLGERTKEPTPLMVKGLTKMRPCLWNQGHVMFTISMACTAV